jgi:hypothetical protein
MKQPNSRDRNIIVEAPPIYLSYLLRLWQIQEESGLAWRASLEEVKTGEKRSFTSLEELIADLRRSTELVPKETDDQTGSEKSLSMDVGSSDSV